MTSITMGCIKYAREQAIKECAELAASIGIDLRNDDAVRRAATIIAGKIRALASVTNQ